MLYTAYDVYTAVFDTARSEFWGTDFDSIVKDIESYEFGAYDFSMTSDVVKQIAEARIAYDESESGQWENDHFWMIEEPLSKIVVLH